MQPLPTARRTPSFELGHHVDPSWTLFGNTEQQRKQRMEARKTFSSAARNFSSSSLRERLLSIHLPTPPIPVTAFPTPNIERVSPLQLRPPEDPPQTEATDPRGRTMVDDDCVVHICMARDDVDTAIMASARTVYDLGTPVEDRPYVFGYHPHGIIGMGALCTFATESTGFSHFYPGIVPHLLTLASNFRMPFYRDILLAMGICSVSKQSCSNILKGGPGQAITIVVGGAAESLSARPGTADLTLRKRLGFIKIAIQHGADLVPVFSFGENDIYEQMPNDPGTSVYTLQKKFQNVFGFTLPLFHGRGLLNYNLGLLPYRRRIVAVIGHPIHVEKCEKPTLEEITHIQQLYIEELMRIWHTHKDEFARTRKRELSIIE
ncbi:hypothetical protein EVJ58_g7399 [Rhodofomes roseus]|uniref:Diacylglycerol O-acyltransferase n=1 Tax=Rhodofomes roseus TaxID=34475 RepID=A0A4Y9Y3Z9_9APHY|nr:hypothetical protein EVJ58_g7399 [Rhodofomes roseus]